MAEPTSQSLTLPPCLVVVNPKAGGYRAELVKPWCEQFVQRYAAQRPGDSERGRTVRTVYTERANHAPELVQAFLADMADMKDPAVAIPSTPRAFIICLGGDGTVHEVINALVEPANPGLSSPPSTSSDRASPGHPVDIGVVPLGSGNALASQLGFRRPSDALDRYLRDDLLSNPLTRRPLHTVDVRLPWGTRWYLTGCPVTVHRVSSFCVISWGFHCNNVASSEWLRCLGPIRFTLAGIKNLVTLTPYHGTLTLTGARRYRPTEAATTTSDHTNHIETPAHLPPPTVDSPWGTFETVTAETLPGPCDTFNADCQQLTLQGPFTVFLAAKLAELSAGFCITPLARPDDADIDVVIGRGLTRSQTLAVFQGAGVRGTHIRLPFVEYYKVRGLTVRPASSWSKALASQKMVDRNSGRGKEGVKDNGSDNHSDADAKEGPRHTLCVDGELYSVPDLGDIVAEIPTARDCVLHTLS
ncbi:hypothetical protein IWQ60_003411 [Tieghemiomyces parasiticus]|uniref:DAGKc domain-containing protein n=1 Tax=Tieghemiomyces parasiticus TaxID=78921 RepID=A0A9W8ACY8_9FUNG|nr:hypothetical protein IWQ60_003411 [Tieghemiomyces parasiticus]